ncbi:MAG: NAD(P)H-dependent oxidoreductase [Aquincola sp.]|nr:NAD(P)H-dependent oxidoreductase [Aquincola sp.]MDH4288609.1 NAD(P)H-dependent oxidoreductase [Aquincola sp.]MDH5328446.1 NAD(P)H-dependent oxidoreductase [Aquincola sp.]
MSSAPLKLLLIAGSARHGALSVRLRDAARRVADGAGAATEVLDLRALGLPLYDGDLEVAQGVPAGATALRDAIAAHDALFIVTPEYNGFPTPLVINAFDWLSRLKDGTAVSAGKPVALLSSSPGMLGGLRAMNFLRQYLQMAFQMLVLPPQQAVGRANEAFAADGALADPKAAATLDGVVHAVLKEAALRR